MPKAKFCEEFEDPDVMDHMMKVYHKDGWQYDEDWYSERIRELLVKSPSGREWRLEDCLRALDGKLMFGDPEQIEALRALNFFNVLYYFGFRDEAGARGLGLL